MSRRPSSMIATSLVAVLAISLAACGSGGGGSKRKVPAAPTIGTATPASGSASIAFTPPAHTGSGPIIDYVASCTGGGATKTAVGTSSPITVTELTNGVAYSCSVVATNSVGASPASAAVSVTPRGVPSPPGLTGVTAGNASAIVAFLTPATNGGAAITGYTATCSGGGVTRTATGTSSPITVTGLTNFTNYVCSVTATNVAGTGPASAGAVVTPSPSGQTFSTDGVLCSYSTNVFNNDASVNAQSTSFWGCNGTQRSLVANGIPDHAVGTFPNAANPYSISVQSVALSYPLTAAIVTPTGAATQIPGHALNGIRFEAVSGGTCDSAGTNCSLNGGTGSWLIEVLGQTSFDFGIDGNNGHVGPTGAYHYHGVPEGLFASLGGGPQMRLVGWAADGFPIYARYGYTEAGNAASVPKVLTGSYQLKATPDGGRPATSLYPLGTFTQDYQYVASSGDLDECNGRVGVTPEFPNGIYYYMITDTYPYVPRCLKG